MTSTIYRDIILSYQERNIFSNSKENETKKEQKNKQARHLFLLTNNLDLYTFLSLLSNLLYFLILLNHVDFLLSFWFSIFIFSKHVRAKMLFSHSFM